VTVKQQVFAQLIIYSSLLSDGNKTTNAKTKTKKVQEQDQDWKDRNCSFKSNHPTLNLNGVFILYGNFSFFLEVKTQDR